MCLKEGRKDCIKDIISSFVAPRLKEELSLSNNDNTSFLLGISFPVITPREEKRFISAISSLVVNSSKGFSPEVSEVKKCTG